MWQFIANKKFQFYKLIYIYYKGINNLVWKAIYKVYPNINKLAFILELELNTFISIKLEQLEIYKIEQSAIKVKIKCEEAELNTLILKVVLGDLKVVELVKRRGLFVI